MVSGLRKSNVAGAEGNDALCCIGHDKRPRVLFRALHPTRWTNLLLWREILREIYSFPARIKILRDNKLAQRGIGMGLSVEPCQNGHRQWSKESHSRIAHIQSLLAIYPGATLVDQHLLMATLQMASQSTTRSMSPDSGNGCAESNIHDNEP